MERPQDRAAREKQDQKFLGASEVKESSSPGQEALLNMCNVKKNQDHIRQKIDTEARIEDKKGKPIVEKLGIKKSKGDALNPYDEAENLKEKGQGNPSTLGEAIPPVADGNAPKKEISDQRNQPVP
jgi:hypothetical protein